MVDTNDPSKGWIVKVMNDAGVSLPSTGGHGTNLIYLLGTILTMLAGAGVMMQKRRKAV